MHKKIIEFIQGVYNTKDFIPLHEPRFFGNEKKYLEDCIDSTFVSSVGKYVDTFEDEIAKFTSSKYAIATANGTAALHISLLLSGVTINDEVITQPLTFIATCNAIKYIGAHPVFVDVDKQSLGMCPEKLETFLAQNTEVKNGYCINKMSKRRIKVVVPMHTFGLPVDMVAISEVCGKYGLKIVEDSAESLGSYIDKRHTGTFGLFGTLSFNGNKTITTGGGGMIITDNEELAKKAKHITTTAKIPHRWDYEHDMVGFNYRMPNINAALGCAQLENLPIFLKRKENLAQMYREFFQDFEIEFVEPRKGTTPNYWLNAVRLQNRAERDYFLEATNNAGVMTRPIWKLMNRLNMFNNAQCGNLDNSLWLEERVVNIPSSVTI